MSVATAKKKVNQAAAFDLDAVLASAAAPDVKTKSKVPVLQVGADIKGQASKIRRLKDEIESKTSELEVISTEFLGAVEPLRENLCRSGYVSSVKVPDSEGLLVSVSWSKSFSKIDVANEAGLREAAGERFADFFRKEMVIEVKDVTEESLTELIQAVGPERFARFFDVKRWIKPTDAFAEQQYTLSPEERQQFMASGVKPYSPSIKPK